MTPKTKKGMWLRRPEQLQHKNWLIHIVGAAMAFGVLTLAFAELTGFAKISHPLALLLTGVCLCILYGFLADVRREGWFYPGILILMLLLILLFRQQVLEGISLFWNQLGDTWTSATGWVLPELKTQLSSRESGSCLLLVSILLGGLGAMLCIWLASTCPAILAVGLPGVLLAGMVGFQREVSPIYLLSVLVTAVFLLLGSGWGRGKAVRPALLSWIAFIAVGCVLVSVAVMPWAVNRAEAFSRNLHNSIHAYKFETRYTTLPEGDLTDFQVPAEDVRPGLVVTMENPEAMYLRGFTGAVFEGNAWTALDPEILAENEMLLYWLNLNEFNPSMQFRAAMLPGEAAENRITVQNIGACSRYLYVPFSLSSGINLSAEDLNNDGIRSDGERIYVFSSDYGGADMLPSMLEYLRTSDEETVARYRKAESAYREFVSGYYLQIPQEIMDLLAEEWEQYGTADSLTAQQAQACVLDFLNRCFTEADMELPLSAAEGTSFQYATVAAMTLRYFGFPARYAEGYVITEEMAAQAEGGASIEVDSTCAGAWVEVYHDGIGWIPMELTPGLGESAENGTGEGLNSENDDTALKEGEELEETPEDNAQEPDGGDMVTISSVIGWGFLLALLSVLLLILLLIVRRYILLSHRQKLFRGENRSDAVARIFADTVLLLEKLGYDRGNGSMRDLCGPIRQRLGEEYARMLKDGIDLNAMAIFSSRELSEEQRENVIQLHSATLQHLQSASKWYSRLYMKWVQCLY